jgi:hypothetical protein
MNQLVLGDCLEVMRKIDKEIVDLIGNHTIAVKAIDNEGLESLEIIRLKINGEVKINTTQ